MVKKLIQVLSNSSETTDRYLLKNSGKLNLTKLQIVI